MFKNVIDSMGYIFFYNLLIFTASVFTLNGNNVL